MGGFVLAPLALGLAVRHRWPRTAERLRVPMFRVSQVSLALAAVVLLALTWEDILAAASVTTVSLMVGFVLAGIVVGHAVLRGYPDEAHVLATVNFSRHPRSRSPSRRRAFPARSSPP